MDGAVLARKPLAYSPEWANAADPADARRIYQALYTQIAPFWLRQRDLCPQCHRLRQRSPGIEGWQWLGFGYYVIDGLRSLEAAPHAADIEIRHAGVGDLDVVLDLEDQLWAHLKSSPVFLSKDDDDDPRAEFAAALAAPNQAFFVAYNQETPVAFIRMEGGNNGACTIVRDPGTVAITGAYTLPAARGDGIGTALLNRGLHWAAQHGFVRCSVDFEAMNVPAAGFWLRHFAPVCISLHRHVNEEAIDD
ncbi:MAG: GNAT family N-acetyltransferase [Caldilineaceae bacterium]